MAFDLALIERALDQAVCDAEDALAERHRNYAGYPDVGKFALYEDAVRDAKSARAEFDRLRKAIEEAPVSWIDMNRWGEDWPDDCVGVDGMDGCSRVLLVKCDE